MILCSSFVLFCVWINSSRCYRKKGRKFQLTVIDEESPQFEKTLEKK